MIKLYYIYNNKLYSNSAKLENALYNRTRVKTFLDCNEGKSDNLNDTTIKCITIPAPFRYVFFSAYPWGSRDVAAFFPDHQSTSSTHWATAAPYNNTQQWYTNYIVYDSYCKLIEAIFFQSMCSTLGHTRELPGMHELEFNPFTVLSSEIQAHLHNVATYCRLIQRDKLEEREKTGNTEDTERTQEGMEIKTKQNNILNHYIKLCMPK